MPETNLARRLRHQDGAAAVEFALIAGVLAMLIFGMLQFGLAFFELQNLRAAVREGARIGAVGANTTQVGQRVSDASLGAIDYPNAAILVTFTYDASASPVNWQPGVCPAATDPLVTNNTAVRVGIDLKNPSLPSSLQDIFTVNVPLLPPIPLTDAAIDGQFRCEDV